MTTLLLGCSSALCVRFRCAAPLRLVVGLGGPSLVHFLLSSLLSGPQHYDSRRRRCSTSCRRRRRRRMRGEAFHTKALLYTDTDEILVVSGAVISALPQLPLTSGQRSK